MAQVFLSYSHEDLPRVSPLVNALEAEGYSIWWDRALQPGDSFENTIDQEIQAAGCIVVIWSEKSVASQWVKNEALEGLDRKILLPVLLDDVRLPVAFKQHQGVNFKRWPETVDPDEYRRFITAIDQVLNRTDTDPRRELKGMHTLSRQRYRRRRRDFATPLTILTMAIACLFVIWWLNPAGTDTQKVTPRLTMTPFVASDAPEAKFYADSMTSEVIQQLGQFDDLELVQIGSLWDLDLIPMSSTMMQQESDFVLSGDLSVNNNIVTIRARLNNLTSNSLLWETIYTEDGDNLFELQKKLVFGVVGQLNLATRQNIETGGLAIITPNKDAYRDYLKGMDLLRRGEQHHILNAIGRFQRAVDIDSTFSAAYAAMCRAYLERYRISNATDEYTHGQESCEQAQALDPKQSDVQLARAELYLTSGELDLARYHYTKTLEINTRSADATMGLAEILTEEGNQQAAEELFMKATRLRPTYWKAQNRLGNFYFRQGLYYQAMESFLRVTQLTTANATAYNNLGAAQFYAGDFEPAYESWRKASEYSTNSAAYSNMGTALYYAGRFKDALHQFETALKMDANDHRLWGNIGDNLRFLKGDSSRINDAYQQAIALAEKNLAINSSNAATNSRLAVYYAAINTPDKARIQIEKTAEIALNDANILYDLAVANALIGDNMASEQYIQLALEAGYPRSLLKSDPQFVQ
ncbi:MAG: adenylate cyclase [Candidatus Azotimanducaceae bacterium]